MKNLFLSTASAFVVAMVAFQALPATAAETAVSSDDALKACQMALDAKKEEKITTGDPVLIDGSGVKVGIAQRPDAVIGPKITTDELDPKTGNTGVVTPKKVTDPNRKLSDLEEKIKKNKEKHANEKVMTGEEWKKYQENKPVVGSMGGISRSSERKGSLNRTTNGDVTEGQKIFLDAYKEVYGTDFSSANFDKYAEQMSSQSTLYAGQLRDAKTRINQAYMSTLGRNATTEELKGWIKPLDSVKGNLGQDYIKNDSFADSSKWDSKSYLEGFELSSSVEVVKNLIKGDVAAGLSDDQIFAKLRARYPEGISDHDLASKIALASRSLR